MHTDKKFTFDIFMVGNNKIIHRPWSLHNSIMSFCIKENSIILTHTLYC